MFTDYISIASFTTVSVIIIILNQLLLTSVWAADIPVRCIARVARGTVSIGTVGHLDFFRFPVELQQRFPGCTGIHISRRVI